MYVGNGGGPLCPHATHTVSIVAEVSVLKECFQHSDRAVTDNYPPLVMIRSHWDGLPNMRPHHCSQSQCKYTDSQNPHSEIHFIMYLYSTTNSMTTCKTSPPKLSWHLWSNKGTWCSRLQSAAYDYRCLWVVSTDGLLCQHQYCPKQRRDAVLRQYCLTWML